MGPKMVGDEGWGCRGSERLLYLSDFWVLFGGGGVKFGWLVEGSGRLGGLKMGVLRSGGLKKWKIHVVEAVGL